MTCQYLPCPRKSTKTSNELQKQPSRGVLIKRCSENMQQIYRRTPMPKCDFNNAALQFYWNLTLAWVSSCKFAAYFQDTFSYENLWTTVSEIIYKIKGESEPSQTSKVDRRFCEKKPLTIFAKKLDLGCFTDSEYTFITKQNHIISFDTETILLRLPWSQFFWHRCCLFCRKKRIKNKYLKKRPKSKLQVCLFSTYWVINIW